MGPDLSGFDEQHSVYDVIDQKFLANLSDSHGEVDLFTRFVTGPLVQFYLWTPASTK
jgi:hypothetical protein